VRVGSLSQLLWLAVPLFLIAFGAGALRALGLRQADPRRRRLFQALWVALLLAGTPAWILAAVALGLV
jgi:hypothetical protein